MVRPDIINFVLEFFITGQLLPETNESLIVFLQKKNQPINISNSSQLVYGNVTYKIISISSSFQAAFVSGSWIFGNSIITQEIIHSMKRKQGNKAWIRVKIDMNKTYYKMEWNLILQIMNRLGFSSHFCQLIHQCLSSVSYSFLLNGSKYGRIIPTRDLR